MPEVYDVFISYRRSDGKTLAFELRKYLSEKGLRVFLDLSNMIDGEYFDDQIRGVLMSAPNYVLIATADVFKLREGEDWLKEEMKIAVGLKEKYPDERTLTVLATPGTEFPESLPDELDRILKVQRTVIESETEPEPAFEKVYEVATRVNKAGIWHAASRWLENSKLPGGRFSNLRIDKMIMPRAGKACEISELPIKVKLGKEEKEKKESVPLFEALKNTDGHMFLIGEGGIGKTTALMKIMEDAYENKTYDSSKQVPVFVELSFAPDNNGKIYESGKSSFIRRSVYKQIINRAVENERALDATEEIDRAFMSPADAAVKPVNDILTKKTPAPEYLLLLDGLNEVSVAEVKGSSEKVVDLVRGEIKYLIEECPNVRVILTSRTEDACGLFGGVQVIRLQGVADDDIADYLIRNGMTANEVGEALANAGLKETLRIPLFLTMYAVLRRKKGVCTQGEILRCFFHERRGNLDVYTAQERITDIGVNFSTSESGVSGVRLTAEMQKFIIDLILPELGYYMERGGMFYCSKGKLRDIVSKVIDGREDTDVCGIYGDDVFTIGGRNGAKHDPSRIADEIIKAFGGDINKITAAVIECLVYSLGIMQCTGREYGFVHQHVRDWFAAACCINAMRLADDLRAVECTDDARAVLDERLKERPLGIQVRRFTGEALGEYMNRPCFSDGRWRGATPSYDGKRLRGLITQIFELYRGVPRGEAGYGVFSLVHILHEVRGDLSGCDFSGIDFTGCSLNGMRLSRKGLIAKFDNALLNYSELDFPGHTGEVRTMRFSPDGRRLVTASADGTAKIWDALTLGLLGTLYDHDGAVNSAEFSPDGSRIITASDDGTVKIWDASSYNTLHTLKPEKHKKITSASYCSDGSRILAVSADVDGLTVVYDAESLEEVCVGSGGYIRSAALSPDGSRILITDYSDTVKIWELGSDEGRHVGEIKASRDERSIVSAAFDPSGDRIVTLNRSVISSDGALRVWDARSFELLGEIDLAYPPSSYCEYSPDGSRIIIGSVGIVIIFDAVSLKVLGTIKSEIDFASFSPDGKKIVTVSIGDQAANSKIQIWDAKTYSLLGEEKVYRSVEVKDVFYGSDEKSIITVTDGVSFKEWNVESGKLDSFEECNTNSILSINGSTGIMSIDHTADRKRIIAAFYDGTMRMWEVDGFKPVCPDNDEWYANQSVSFSSDGKRIVAVGWYGGSVTVFDADDLRIINEVESQKAIVDELFNFDEYSVDDLPELFESAAFSPDGSCIAVSLSNGSVNILDADSLELISGFDTGNMSGGHASYSPDGKRIITVSSDDKTVKVWDWERGELVFELKDILKTKDRDDFPGFISALYSPDGEYIVTVSESGAVKIWDAENGENLSTFFPNFFSDKSGAIVSFRQDGKRLVTASEDGSVIIWNVEDARHPQSLSMIPNIPGLLVKDVDLTRLDKRSVISQKEMILLDIYGAII